MNDFNLISNRTLARTEMLIKKLEGNNIAGRSKVHEIALSASIAAYEKFIEDWKNEK